ncbi:EpsG family protein [Halarsenatibacter silvermanii]|uniref:EpsG family protein n=1 Tax=Halarsenatibacter silvermanii TaxID=321763 RepID=A0A1G9SAK7_9FIRM|nr:EpsG family protein [Halarsenatibacter silvermanii]SDM32411.1 EpsG family protein [Halarsenatibacter silvermanii]
MVSSYIIYISTVIFATVFAGLAQKYCYINKKGNVVPNKMFWFMSMGILVFIMGFRDLSVGVDGGNYLRIYKNINELGVIEYIQNTTHEPGYIIFNRLIYLIFNDFQWVLILSSLFIIFGVYKALEYEIKNISLPLAVFIFSTTQYFYYFGIIRLGMAVSIIAFAYRYILEDKKTKYILMVLVATMFHFSALFALGLIFLTQRKKGKFYKRNIIIIALIVPVAFFMVRAFIFPLINIDRYQRYIQSSIIGIDLGFLPWLPFLFLFLIHYNKFVRTRKNYQFYFYLYIMRIVTEMSYPILGGGRMIWYVYLSVCFLLPATVRVNKNKFVKLILLVVIIFFSIVYSYHAYFASYSYRGPTMFPYINIIFQ